MNRNILTAGALVVVIVGVAFLSWNTSFVLGLRGYEKETSYRPGAVCLAVIPACGVCEGVVLGEDCYIKK